MITGPGGCIIPPVGTIGIPIGAIPIGAIPIGKPVGAIPIGAPVCAIGTREPLELLLLRGIITTGGV